MGKRTLSSTFRQGRRTGLWKTMPTSGDGPSSGFPRTRMVPAVGGGRPPARLGGAALAPAPRAAAGGDDREDLVGVDVEADPLQRGDELPRAGLVALRDAFDVDEGRHPAGARGRPAHLAARNSFV